jgi:hypothetical protein
VHYFRVFGSKCFILNKKTKSSKFAPKVDEDFLLGYGTNKHAYHVFNKTTSCVEVMVDATFDESDSSRVGKIDKNLVDEEEPLSQSIMRMGLGEVRPHEVEAQASVQENNNDLSLSTRVEPPSSQQPQVQNQVHGIDQGENKVEKLKKMLHKLKIMCMDLFNLHQSVQRDHPVDNILGSIQRGVATRSRLATFCGHYSFVSSLESLKVDEALDDPDWVIAMQEELNNFTRNEVWLLVERPKQNVIGTKWVFRNKQDEHGVITRNKARLVAQGFTQIEGLDFGETYSPVVRLESI